jgi:hypothetical protein
MYLDTIPPRKSIFKFALRARKITVLGALATQFHEISGLEVAKDVGFLNQNSPEQIRELLVNLTRRGRVNKRELLILTGLIGMIKKRIAAPRDTDKH